MTGAPPHQELCRLGVCRLATLSRPCPGKVQAREEPDLTQGPQEEKQNLDILYHWLGRRSWGVVPLRDATEAESGSSGKSGAFSTGALELESKAWLKVSSLRLSFLVHKMRDLDLPGPQVPF